MRDVRVAARDAELNARQREIRDLIDAELLRRSSDEASVQAAREPELRAPPPAEPSQAEPSPRAVVAVRPPNPFLCVVTDAERAAPLEHYHPSWTRIT